MCFVGGDNYKFLEHVIDIDPGTPPEKIPTYENDGAIARCERNFIGNTISGLEYHFGENIDNISEDYIKFQDGVLIVINDIIAEYLKNND